ncbi:hypothetical protein [Lentzea nigeriaca]|uniref:hypothetical protein n=1 Tax=Lentzea nigeriaca TaxID=1128665 RepID=UPI00195D7E53|nr:hypothetical protein [Lentzea nigeriaca]MBM7856518.1 hypothetical protein [Lentzea nigeriaca]
MRTRLENPAARPAPRTPAVTVFPGGHSVLELQRAAGNRAVGRLLSQTVQRCGPVPCDCTDEERQAKTVQRQTVQRQPARRRQSTPVLTVCWAPIGMLGLGRVGGMHGIINVGAHGRRQHLEVDPTQHQAGLPLHSHVVVRNGWRTTGTCTTTAITVAQADAIMAAGAEYEGVDVRYDPVSGPNSNSFVDWTLTRAGVPSSALGSPPAGALQWDYYAQHPGERGRPPGVGRPVAPTTASCTRRFRPTSTMAGYVDLLRHAELALMDCGRAGLEDRLILLSGIYYGTLWSRDYATEHDLGRNAGFSVYTAHVTAAAADDPRLCLRCGLFEALRQSQDVTGPAGRVDMGHVITGLNARMRTASRSVPLPLQGATGMESVTWAGDLGGATGRLAMDRATNPSAAPGRYFRGTDYGASSNLEGDVAAFVVGTGRPRRVEPLTVPTPGTVADLLQSYFLSRRGSGDHHRHFLELYGAQFDSGGRLLNRADVETTFADKLASFGRFYVVQRYGVAAWSRAASLSDAGRDVARVFVDWLLDRMRAR